MRLKKKIRNLLRTTFLVLPILGGVVGGLLSSCRTDDPIIYSTTYDTGGGTQPSGDISGIAIQLTQSLDIEKAEQNAIAYQNVADKMVRLFKFGLAKELVNKKEKETAVTEFAELKISAKFKIWRPFSATEYNNMLIQLHNEGLISDKTGIEKNTEATPDEYARVEKQKKEEAEEEEKKLLQQQKTNTTNNKNE